MSPGVFPRALGAAFEDLPAAVRAVHQGEQAVRLHGCARARGAGGAAALVRRLQGLPGPGVHDTTVTIAPLAAGGEAWMRRFGDLTLTSRVDPARRDPRAFEETVGLLAFRFHAEPCASGLGWA